MATYLKVPNLLGELEMPEMGQLSRTLQNDDAAKIILFSFAAGHGLAEHRAPMPAIIQILSGEAALTIGPDTLEAEAGFWVSLPPDLGHSLTAKTPVTMLLTLIKRSNSTASIG